MAIEKDTTRKVADTIKGTEETVAGAATEQTKDAVDTLRQNVAGGARVQREAAETGRRTAEQGAETMRQVAGTVADTAGKVTEDATHRFSQFLGASARASEEAVQRTQQTLDAMMQTGSVVGEGMQSILREWVNYTQGAMQRQTDAVNEIMKVRSIQDLVAIQADRVRQEMELLLDTSARISEQAARVSSDAYGKLHDQAERARKFTGRAA